MPLNKQVRGPNNKLMAKPSKPYSLAETAPRTNAPAMRKAGTKGAEPPKETKRQEMAEYDRPDLDYE